MATNTALSWFSAMVCMLLARRYMCASLTALVGPDRACQCASPAECFFEPWTICHHVSSQKSACMRVYRGRLEFVPMCIDTYWHPSFRTALIESDVLRKTKESIMLLVKKLMLQEESLVLPKLDTIMYSPETTPSKTVATPTIPALTVPKSRFKKLKFKITASLPVADSSSS